MGENIRLSLMLFLTILLVVGLPIASMLYDIGQKVEKKPYEYRIFRLNPQAYEYQGHYRGENVEEFVERVLDFAATVEAYDVTYHSTSIMVKVKGYVVTPSRPKVVFFGDGQTALVWWWTSRERFSKNVKED